MKHPALGLGCVVLYKKLQHMSHVHASRDKQCVQSGLYNHNHTVLSPTCTEYSQTRTESK